MSQTEEQILRLKQAIHNTDEFITQAEGDMLRATLQIHEAKRQREELNKQLAKTKAENAMAASAQLYTEENNFDRDSEHEAIKK